MAGSASSGSNYNKLKEIVKYYQDSATLARKALKLDEENQHAAAAQCYLKCLEHTEKGVKIDITGEAYSGSEWDDARDQQQKMRNLQAQTKERLSCLEQQSYENELPVPEYSDSVPDGHSSLSYTEGATELLIIPGGVQIFFVSEDEHVATTPPSYPTFLKVMESRSGCFFIKVNDWNYPLLFGQTPVFKTNSGIYLFPNKISHTITRGSVGIVISSVIDQLLIETFEYILHNLAIFKKQSEEDEVDVIDEVPAPLRLRDLVKLPTSGTVAAGLTKGAELVCTGISTLADGASRTIQTQSANLKEKLIPSDSPMPVSPAVQTSLHYAHEVSKATVQVSRYLVDRLCEATGKVSDQLAPHIKEYGQKILPQSVTDNGGQGESVVDGAVKVAGAGLYGITTVWSELERSGLVIVQAVSKATVENVEFKYGKDAGLVTTNAMGTVVNVGKTAFNIDNLGMKAIARRTAKDTGRAVLHNYDKSAHKSVKESQV